MCVCSICQIVYELDFFRGKNTDISQNKTELIPHLVLPFSIPFFSGAAYDLLMSYDTLSFLCSLLLCPFMFIIRLFLSVLLTSEHALSLKSN